jgi:hypothetical protein
MQYASGNRRFKSSIVNRESALGYALNHHRIRQIATITVPALRRNIRARSYVASSALRSEGNLYVGSSSTIGRFGPLRMVRRMINAVSIAALAPSR